MEEAFAGEDTWRLSQALTTKTPCHCAVLPSNAPVDAVELLAGLADGGPARSIDSELVSSQSL